MSIAFSSRALLLGLVCLLAACARQFEPVPPPTPNLIGTYVGTWGGQPTTLVIQNYGAAQPEAGLFLGSMSVGGMPEMVVSGTISHPSPQGPLESTFSARVGYVEGKLILSLSLPTTNPMSPFEELPLAVEGEGQAQTLVGKAEHDYPEGPRGPIRLTRQAPASR